MKRQHSTITSILAAASTIAWAFLGIGGGARTSNASAPRLTMPQIVVAGLVGGALFVVTLVVLVSVIVRSHGA
jgi:amino acid transporter